MDNDDWSGFFKDENFTGVIFKRCETFSLLQNLKELTFSFHFNNNMCIYTCIYWNIVQTKRTKLWTDALFKNICFNYDSSSWVTGWFPDKTFKSILGSDKHVDETYNDSHIYTVRTGKGLISMSVMEHNIPLYITVGGYRLSVIYTGQLGTCAYCASEKHKYFQCDRREVNLRAFPNQADGAQEWDAWIHQFECRTDEFS